MISDHEVSALDHARILEFHKFFSEYHIWLQMGLERFLMKIRIFETGDGRFHFVQSHSIRLPHEVGALVPTVSRHETPHLALSAATQSITASYEDAIAGGHEPLPDWFIANDDF